MLVLDMRTGEILEPETAPEAAEPAGTLPDRLPEPALAERIPTRSDTPPKGLLAGRLLERLD